MFFVTKTLVFAGHERVEKAEVPGMADFSDFLCRKADVLCLKADVLRLKEDGLCLKADVLRRTEDGVQLKEDVFRRKDNVLCLKEDSLRRTEDVLCRKEDGHRLKEDVLRRQEDALRGKEDGLRRKDNGLWLPYTVLQYKSTPQGRRGPQNILTNVDCMAGRQLGRKIGMAGMDSRLRNGWTAIRNPESAIGQRRLRAGFALDLGFALAFAFAGCASLRAARAAARRAIGTRKGEQLT